MFTSLFLHDVDFTAFMNIFVLHSNIAKGLFWLNDVCMWIGDNAASRDVISVSTSRSWSQSRLGLSLRMEGLVHIPGC